MNAIQFGSLVAIISGLTIYIYPDILQILLATILVVVGINGLIFGAKVKKAFTVKINK